MAPVLLIQLNVTLRHARVRALSATFTLQPQIRLHQILFWEIATLQPVQRFRATADERTQKCFLLPLEPQNILMPAGGGAPQACARLSLALISHWLTYFMLML